MDGTNIRRKKSGLLAGPAAAEPRTSPLLPGPGAGALPALGRGAGRWGNCVLGQHAPQEGKGCREVQSLWTVCFRRSHPEGSDLGDGIESWGVALYQDGEGPSDTWGDPGVGSFMY